MRALWPSVYAFVCESRKSVYIATAFFVRKVPKPGRPERADYHFITAGHAIEDCRNPRRYLAENVYQPYFERDGITVARPPRRLDGVKPVYVDDAYDMAVVSVEASASLAIGKPVPVDDRCGRSLHREIYAIGFPGVGKRRSLHLKREEKRWSKGDYVGLGKADFRGVEATYIASSVDSLPGNSGGPVVDAAGRWSASSRKASRARTMAFATTSIPRRRTTGRRSWCRARPWLRALRRSGLTQQRR